jgi:lipopolysaccharide exporter
MKEAFNPNQTVCMESISHRVIRSGFWSLSGNWLARGLSIIKMIVLARILMPQDLGVFGLVMLSVGCLSVLSEIGIEAALIQKSRVHRDDLNTAWTMAIIRGGLLFLLLFLLANPCFK